MNKSRRLDARESPFVCSGWPFSGCDLYPALPVGRCLSFPTAVTGVTLR